MTAHMWVTVLTLAVIVLAAAFVVVVRRGTTWKHAFLFRVSDEQLANLRHPNGPSPYELAMQEVRRHA